MVAAIFNFECDVGLQLFVQTVAKLAGCYVLALPAGKWRVVKLERHLEGGLIDGNPAQRLRLIRAGESIADIHRIEPAYRIQIADVHMVYLDPPQTGKVEQLAYALEAVIAVLVDNLNVLPG